MGYQVITAGLWGSLAAICTKLTFDVSDESLLGHSPAFVRLVTFAGMVLFNRNMLAASLQLLQQTTALKVAKCPFTQLTVASTYRLSRQPCVNSHQRRSALVF